MFECNTPPPAATPPNASGNRPPSHEVHQIIEDEEQVYKMKVGSGWSLVEGGDVHKLITIHGEFEITKIRGASALH